MASTADIRRQATINKRYRQLKEANGLLFYKPHAKQELFHRAGRYKRRYARTGNRFGKSEMGAAEDCSWALGERIFYPKDDPARYIGIPQRPNKILIVCQTWKKVEEVFTSREGGANQGKLWRFLPKNSIVDYKSEGGHIVKIIVKSKFGSGELSHSVIRFTTVKTYQNDKLDAESSDHDAIHIDEPIPRKMWTALGRGLVDRGGSAWFTCTPLDQMWINRMFIPPHQIRETLTTPLYDDSKSTFVMTGGMRDNPHNSPESIAQYIQDLGGDATEQDCRLHGIPIALSGLIYKAFDRNKHVYYDCPHGWEDKKHPPKDWTRRIYIDCHPKTPQAVSFFATSPTGLIRQYDEIFEILSIPELSQVILDRTRGLDIAHIGCDPLAWNPHPNDGSCMADDFFDAGIYIEPATKELRRGILATQHLFSRTDNSGKEPYPIFQVNSDCDEFLYEIDEYVWDPDKEKPGTDEDHMMENLYRATVEGLNYQSPSAKIQVGDLRVAPILYDTSLPNLDALTPLEPAEDNMSISWT